jgi:hypothetical protein
MKDSFGLEHLRCSRCGSELPVMGKGVVFRCGTCGSHWSLARGKLAPAAVYRADPPEGYSGQGVYIPFWVFTAESVSFSGAAGRPGERAPHGEKHHMLEGSEIGHIVSRIENERDFRVFVPAFLTANSHAYLKVGKLMTKSNPSFTARKTGRGPSGLPCALEASQALMLVDYILISTLPPALTEGSGLPAMLRVKTRPMPMLVEFPFARDGAYLVSAHCGFQISASVISGSREQAIEQPL